MRLRGEWFDFLRLNVSWVSWWLSTGPAQNEKIVTYCGIQCGSLRISLAVDFRLPRLALCACQTSAREDGPMEELAELQIKVLLTRICFAARCSGNQRDQTLVIPQSVDRLSSYSYSMHFYAYIIYIALAYCVEKVFSESPAVVPMQWTLCEPFPGRSPIGEALSGLQEAVS